MFGLMRRAQRLPYCGTCKTLGALYGQRTRLLLDHDTVFLAELRVEHSGDPEWSPGYRSFNCLSLPKASDRIPLALDYAAAVTVVLAHFKFDDHWVDTKRFRWRLATQLVSPAYRRATARLESWKFLVDDLVAMLQTQADREARPRSIAHVAEPTAYPAGLVCSHGARLIGREGLTDAMYHIGHRFGSLIYVLDAFEDQERDARAGDFNPLRTFPEIDGREEILAATASLERDLPPGLAVRLRANIEERLGMRPRVLNCGCNKTGQQRRSDAVAFARSMRDRESPGLLKGAAVLASVALMAFLFPHHDRSAESPRQCLGLLLNLMAMGSIFANIEVPTPAPDGNKGSKCGSCSPDCDCGDCCDCDCCGCCCDC